MNDKRYNIVFIGRSGCGKGTQAELFKKVLEEKNGPGSVLYVYTGARLRELASHSEFFTARLLNKKSLESGELTPNSLAIWAYATEFIHGVTDSNHIIIDGSPRQALEAEALDEMFYFYDRENIFHVCLNVSEAWAGARMKERGRSDDGSESIKRRFAYYEREVVPTIEFYKKDTKHKLVEINGEQSIEKVHKDIIKAVGL
ncbi:MAG: Adenylate kinase [Candidatus Giovannonibacteria bacterium GW2011_GWC2_44_9]|uniref:Adenylate kinase n=3 Tax=Candidatus Giovannoniibacteriota TaxID=1752738 RepID=A0A0G1IYA7_9BACT|nr:MAG: Adenylate kinase [Candidatus Giovannonibacteria bacterium GW2011_GWB1_44_23]KKT64040.1 MAG: Adenylate kinase [Candidatus Giovannonibacteria bacterium GW2011_GWA1_44_29]KKT83907.1 MAG: Adenylate kinase [Candidatus Giovannonibacteria bacterium GW2011_GWC2_44_9]KKT91888.1 MAG: Adenylate kinase [Parcubacteria group bacterium GW2011_GWC1_45_13]